MAFLTNTYTLVPRLNVSSSRCECQDLKIPGPRPFVKYHPTKKWPVHNQWSYTAMMSWVLVTICSPHSFPFAAITTHLGRECMEICRQGCSIYIYMCGRLMHVWAHPEARFKSFLDYDFPWGPLTNCNQLGRHRMILLINYTDNEPGLSRTKSHPILGGTGTPNPSLLINSPTPW